HVSDVALADVGHYVDRTFRPVAEEKGLEFSVEIDEASVPPTIGTDEQRLHQVLKNLVSNACKFTEKGNVALRVSRAPVGTRFHEHSLTGEETVIAFTVAD